VLDLLFLPDGDGDRDPTPAACGDRVSLTGVAPRELDGAVLERPRAMTTVSDERYYDLEQ
jgi:hypothetical protein